LMRKNWCDVLGNGKTVAVDICISLLKGTKKSPSRGFRWGGVMVWAVIWLYFPL
jgi:hypothetical protein